jgi:hypothetical protein
LHLLSEGIKIHGGQLKLLAVRLGLERSSLLCFSIKNDFRALNSIQTTYNLYSFNDEQWEKKQSGALI